MQGDALFYVWSANGFGGRLPRTLAVFHEKLKGKAYEDDGVNP